MVYDGVERRSGQLAEVGIRAEDTYGTRQSANTQFDVRCKSCFFEEVPQLIVTGGIRDSRAGTGYQEVGEWVEASMEGELINAAIMVFGLGKVTTTGSSPYTHTIKPIRQTVNETDLYAQSYTLEGRYNNPDGASDTVYTLLGALVRSFTETIPLTGDRRATWSADILGKSIGSTGSAITESTAATMYSGNTSVLLDDNATSYSSGTQVEGVNSISYTVNHNYPTPDNFFSFGATDLDRTPYPGTLRGGITGTFTRKYIDADLWSVTEPFSLRIYHNRGANDTIAIDLNNCRFSRARKGMFNVEEPIENVPVPFNVTELVITAVDSTATYV